MSKSPYTICPDGPEPERKPLTDEEIVALFNRLCQERSAWPERRYRDFARWVERAHGIGEQPVARKELNIQEAHKTVAAEERKRIVDMLLDMHSKEERHNYFLFIANIIKESA